MQLSEYNIICTYIHTHEIQYNMYIHMHTHTTNTNVVANVDCKLKICDFELARVAFHDNPKTIF